MYSYEVKRNSKTKYDLSIESPLTMGGDVEMLLALHDGKMDAE
jgi:hypothetical protein